MMMLLLLIALQQVTEEEAEWLFDIPGAEALEQPERVRHLHAITSVGV